MNLFNFFVLYLWSIYNTENLCDVNWILVLWVKFRDFQNENHQKISIQVECVSNIQTLFNDPITYNFVISVYCRCLQILYQIAFFYKI